MFKWPRCSQENLVIFQNKRLFSLRWWIQWKQQIISWAALCVNTARGLGTTASHHRCNNPNNPIITTQTHAFMAQTKEASLGHCGANRGLGGVIAFKCLTGQHLEQNTFLWHCHLLGFSLTLSSSFITFSHSPRTELAFCWRPILPLFVGVDMDAVEKRF